MKLPLLIAFSQVRWGFVYQRPQHLMTRLSRHWRVLFVEEPVRNAGPACIEEQWLDKNLTVLVPHTPSPAPGFSGEQQPMLQRLLAKYLQARGQTVDVAWLCTPMAWPLAQALRPACVVYDCMEDLSLCGTASGALQQLELDLLEQADVVLTDGPSLYEARRDQRPSVVCLPSAVEALHFAPGELRADSTQARQAHALQGTLPRPRLGFFGVVDELFDTDLLAKLADARTQWSLVMAGPVAGIDASTLPHRPNIHWLGIQPYARLPYLLAGWDLCLLPYKVNESTRRINPINTLEYMAGGKPVVSTPLHDVVWMHSDAVAIAPRGPAFVETCEKLLAEAPAARSQRELAMLAAVFGSSWDRTTQAVNELLQKALAQARAQLGAVPAKPPSRVLAAARG
jgi:glycosyltransferase involved in cell wall biosynthesis